jgi:type VI protein secretion system component VasK
MQQINLYLPEFQPNREPLRAVHMLWGVLVLVALLVIASALSSNSNKTMAAQIEIQRAQVDQLKRQLGEINKGQPQANLAALDAEILGLTNDLMRRE